MIQGNYTVKAIAGLPRARRWLEDRHLSDDIDRLEAISILLRTAQPFLLPPGGLLFDADPNRYRPVSWRTPYPAVSLEFSREGIAHVLLICDRLQLGAGDDHLTLMHFIEIGPQHTVWLPIQGVRIRPNESPDAAAQFPTECQFFDPLPSMSLLAERDGVPDKRAAHFKLEQSILAQLLCALECKNVRVDDLPPPSRLQAKRLRDKKLPLLTYKVLTLDTEPTVVHGPGGGTHASPRTHLRRGHIRRLPSGNIWVNATVVKGASRGLVVKDYRMTA